MGATTSSATTLPSIPTPNLRLPNEPLIDVLGHERTDSEADADVTVSCRIARLCDYLIAGSRCRQREGCKVFFDLAA